MTTSLSIGSDPDARANAISLHTVSGMFSQAFLIRQCGSSAQHLPHSTERLVTLSSHHPLQPVAGREVDVQQRCRSRIAASPSGPSFGVAGGLTAAAWRHRQLKSVKRFNWAAYVEYL